MCKKKSRIALVRSIFEDKQQGYSNGTLGSSNLAKRRLREEVEATEHDVETTQEQVQEARERDLQGRREVDAESREKGGGGLGPQPYTRERNSTR